MTDVEYIKPESRQTKGHVIFNMLEGTDSADPEELKRMNERIRSLETQKKSRIQTATQAVGADMLLETCENPPPFIMEEQEVDIEMPESYYRDIEEEIRKIDYAMNPGTNMNKESDVFKGRGLFY